MRVGMWWENLSKETTWKRGLKLRDGIKMDLREVDLGGGGVNWIDAAQDRVRWHAIVNSVMSFQIP
jgi:hypothetical protein